MEGGCGKDFGKIRYPHFLRSGRIVLRSLNRNVIADITGKLNVLVNNAGIANFATIETYSEQMWDDMVRSSVVEALFGDLVAQFRLCHLSFVFRLASTRTYGTDRNQLDRSIQRRQSLCRRLESRGSVVNHQYLVRFVILSTPIPAIV